MRSRDRGLLRSLEHQLWLVAVGMLAVSAFVAAEGTIYQFYLNWKFDDALEAEQRLASTRGEMEPIALPNVSAPIPSAPIASLPPSAPTHAAPVVPPSYLGRLEIPRLDMSIMLLDGVDNRTLRRGIGHIPGTPFPGKRGNAGIAGHRDTFSALSKEFSGTTRFWCRRLRASISIPSSRYALSMRSPSMCFVTLVTPF